ncbi:Hypothetical predicted protein [Mytilus galloprovincialis]|uniref:Methyltransferase domain-containing protein n=1 Tax=Mytilus galloprovincialis TaxID=29158 RepID=A0A8B6DPE5_MYTGA|nr:Hypothetical predicted protein [Mytilus galloprovincialis]
MRIRPIRKKYIFSLLLLAFFPLILVIQQLPSIEQDNRNSEKIDIQQKLLTAYGSVTTTRDLISKRDTKSVHTPLNKIKSNKPAAKVNVKQQRLSQGIIIRGGRRFIRSGGSLSLDLRRQPAFFADELDPTTDWWKAFIELADDLKSVKKDFRCAYMKSRGNWWDCNSYQYKIHEERPCLVYSFGIGNDFRFDDTMATLRCEVHSFDPSMNVSEYTRESGVVFHTFGIGSQNDDSFTPRTNEYIRKEQKSTWKLGKLSTILSNLGHQNMTLDILKLDIEGYEWDVLENIVQEGLLSKVKQLEVEYHIFPDFPKREKYVDVLKTFQSLWKLNFRRYYKFVHQFTPNENMAHLQADVAYVNGY